MPIRRPVLALDHRPARTPCRCAACPSGSTSTIALPVRRRPSRASARASCVPAQHSDDVDVPERVERPRRAALASEASSRTSHAIRSVRRPRCSISAATSSTSGWRRAVATTSAPASARPSASTRPMPLVPPTTTAVLAGPDRRAIWVHALDPAAGAARAALGRGLRRLTPAPGSGCLQQVFVHRAPRLLGVARADRLVDAPVRLGRVAQIAIGRALAPSRGAARSRAPTPCRRARRRSGCCAAVGDAAMEVDVVHEEQVRIVEVGEQAGDFLGERREVLGGRPLGRQPGGFRPRESAAPRTSPRA